MVADETGAATKLQPRVGPLPTSSHYTLFPAISAAEVVPPPERCASPGWIVGLPARGATVASVPLSSRSFWRAWRAFTLSPGRYRGGARRWKSAKGSEVFCGPLRPRSGCLWHEARLVLAAWRLGELIDCMLQLTGGQGLACRHLRQHQMESSMGSLSWSPAHGARTAAASSYLLARNKALPSVRVERPAGCRPRRMYRRRCAGGVRVAAFLSAARAAILR